MKFLLQLFIFSLFTAICSIVHGQSIESFPLNEDVIKVDAITRKPEKAIPFDRPFSLLITLNKTDDIVNVFAYYVALENGTRNINEASPIPNVKHRIVEKQLVVDFPPLPPKTHFDFCIIRKFSGDNLIEFRQFVDTLAKKNVERIGILNAGDVEDNYTRFKAKMEKQVYRNNRSALGKDYLFSAAGVDPDRVLDTWFTSIRVDTFYSNIFNHNYNFAPPADLEDVIVHNATVFNTNKEDATTLNLLYRIIKEGKFTNLTDGTLPIHYDYTSLPANKYAFADRISNLDTTISQLRKSLRQAEKLFLITGAADAEIESLTRVLQSLIVQLVRNRNVLNNNFKGLNKTIQDQEDLRYTEWFINTSDFRDLQTMAGYVLLPQIGIGGVVVRKNDNELNLLPKLLLGVNIFLKPIDKSLKRKYIPNKNIWNYLSISLAVALGKFDDPEFDNLSTGTSILLGPALRLNRSFYISMGASFFRQLDVNPLKNQKRTRVGGYVSVLLDIDITSTVSGVRSLLFK